MTKIRRVLATALLTVAASGLASADQIISYQTSFSGTTDFTHVFSLSKFNLTGETLTGVTLTFAASEDTSGITLQNQSGTTLANGAQTFHYVTNTVLDTFSNTASNDLPGPVNLAIVDTGTITLGGGGNNPPNGIGGVVCATGTPNANCNTVSYTPPDILGGPVSTTAVVAAARFGGYIGAGNFSITGETGTFTSFNGGGGNIALNQTTSASETITVAYSYIPASSTPEPSAMTLFGSGLLGLGLLRRRFKS